MLSNRHEEVIPKNIYETLISNYDIIAECDLSTGRVFIHRANGVWANALKYQAESEGLTLEWFRKNIKEKVAQEDRAGLLKLFTEEFVKSQFKDDNSYYCDYRATIEGVMITRQLKAVRFEDESGDPNFKRILLTDRHVDYSYCLTDPSFGESVLIVEDNSLNRMILKSILEERYIVYEAEQGQQALEILENNWQQISMVVSDLDMPVCNGYEFLQKMRANPLYGNIPVIVTTANDTAVVEKACLDLGASDFVIKPYNADVLINRVNALVKLKETTALMSAVEKDAITGLYTKETFYIHAERIINNHPELEYILLAADIVNFKATNAKFGVENGDKVLKDTGAFLAENIPGYVVGARLDGDKFICLCQSLGAEVEEADKILSKALEEKGPSTPSGKIGLKFGKCCVEKNGTIREMSERAITALNKIKSAYGVYLCEYDDKLRNDLIEQQQIVESMESALAEKQFKIYLQPKHDVKHNKTGGAEALIRWIHPELGFMNPGKFIPIFEQNGFIKEVDTFVLEEICKIIRHWMDNGMPIVPISVNLSRRDFEVKNLAERIVKKADEYRVPHEYIHFELTESAYSDNPKKIEEELHLLHKNNFVIELDDFGAGYSSLSVLNDMDIDIIKLDRSLIESDDPSGKRSALEFSVQLSNIMGLKTVAEGAETLEQVNRLKALGCSYIQGFYFSKPLPVEEFEEYLKSN